MYKIDTDHGIEVFLVTGLEVIKGPPTTFLSLIQTLNFIIWLWSGGGDLGMTEEKEATITVPLLQETEEERGSFRFLRI